MVETSKAAEVANKTNATEEATDAPAVVEMSPLCEETFNEPEIPQVAFRCKWSLWEHYESQAEKMDYASSMCKVCWFNDMISFVTAWSTIPHSDLANIFFNDETKTCKM